MWPHVFRSEVESYSSYFLVNYLSYILFLLVRGNCTINLKMGRCSNLLLVDSQLNQTDFRKNIISCPIQNKIEILLIIKTASLYLYSLIETASKVFIPTVFPETYHQISQNPSIRITCGAHWFHRIKMMSKKIFLFIVIFVFKVEHTSEWISRSHYYSRNCPLN